MGWVYAIESRGLIKIGMSKSVSGRFHAIASCNPSCRLLGKAKVPNAYAVEAYIHRLLKENAVGHEWFRITEDEALAALDHGLVWGCDLPIDSGTVVRRIRGLIAAEAKI